MMALCIELFLFKFHFLTSFNEIYNEKQKCYQHSHLEMALSIVKVIRNDHRFYHQENKNCVCLSLMNSIFFFFAKANMIKISLTFQFLLSHRKKKCYVNCDLVGLVMGHGETVNGEYWRMSTLCVP